jgi:hypothetical protein
MDIDWYIVGWGSFFTKWLSETYSFYYLVNPGLVVVVRYTHGLMRIWHKKILAIDIEMNG